MKQLLPDPFTVVILLLTVVYTTFSLVALYLNRRKTKRDNSPRMQLPTDFSKFYTQELSVEVMSWEEIFELFPKELEHIDIKKVNNHLVEIINILVNKLPEHDCSYFDVVSTTSVMFGSSFQTFTILVKRIKTKSCQETSNQ